MSNGIVNHIFFKVLLGILLGVVFTACSDSPWRYSTAPAAVPAGVTATAGNGQVSLTWGEAANAAAYHVYYSTTPGVTATGTMVQSDGTSAIVTGLSNDVTYYFAVSAVNASGETPLSAEVSATPAPPGPFLQSDLQGTWYFNGLASGSGAGWMRGSVTIDGSGNVTVSSFVDNTGNTTPQSGLFSTLTIVPDGFVTQTGGEFRGFLSNNQYKDMLVGTAAGNASSRIMLILQKRVTGITFTSSDIKGTGRVVAGPLPFVYHQLVAGVNQRWERATGQIGQDQSETYLSINAPTSPALPGGGSKIATLSITADGIVTETPIAGVSPQPSALMTHGVMSSDKMTVVGTATDVNGAFVLRVMQFIHPPATPLTSSVYTLANLAGSYGLETLLSGGSGRSAYGTVAIDPTGAGSYSNYVDSSGSTTLPSPFTVATDAQGGLTTAGDPSYHGQLSYFHDMTVATRTESSGGYSISIGLKR